MSEARPGGDWESNDMGKDFGSSRTRMDSVKFAGLRKDGGFQLKSKSIKSETSQLYIPTQAVKRSCSWKDRLWT